MNNKKVSGSKSQAAICQKFQFIPEWRLYKCVRWEIWTGGWMGIIFGLVNMIGVPLGFLNSQTEGLGADRYFVAAISVMVGIIGIFGGVGLWNLRKWARVIGIAFCGFLSISGIIGLIATTYYFGIISFQALFASLLLVLSVFVTFGLALNKQVQLNFDLKASDGTPLDFLSCNS